MIRYELHPALIVAVSELTDGTMKMNGADAATVKASRGRLLSQVDSKSEQSVLVQLDYDSDDFCRYTQVDSRNAGEGMTRKGAISDGILTMEPGLGLFLPVADCIGAILYDPGHNALMLSHLGRHNLEQNGGARSVEYMQRVVGSSASNLMVFMGPSAGQANYPMFAFDGRSLEALARGQLEQAGVTAANISSAHIDTTNDPRYFSHSQFLKGNQMDDGRFAVFAMLKK